MSVRILSNAMIEQSATAMTATSTVMGRLSAV
jgi:hypothetical protein